MLSFISQFYGVELYLIIASTILVIAGGLGQYSIDTRWDEFPILNRVFWGMVGLGGFLAAYTLVVYLY